MWRMPHDTLPLRLEAHATVVIGLHISHRVGTGSEPIRNSLADIPNLSTYLGVVADKSPSLFVIGSRNPQLRAERAKYQVCISDQHKPKGVSVVHRVKPPPSSHSGINVARANYGKIISNRVAYMEHYLEAPERRSRRGVDSLPFHRTPPVAIAARDLKVLAVSLDTVAGTTESYLLSNSSGAEIG